ncbi:MAG: ABC transporter substrate-binding protein [Chloroflexi bacterium]|nr:ABC transporter substrate-binding protein [Chloroflexota bacterium]
MAVSRRGALRMLGSAVGVTLLVACQVPTPAAPATTAPPAAPQPTAAAAAATSSAPAAAPTQAAIALNDPAAQAGFLPVGVSPNSTAPLSAPKGQPRSGGTLTEGNLGDLPNLDGHWINGQHITYAIFDRLVDLDGSLQPHPALAESWEANPDFTQVTFHLRPGVTWHTGRAFSAEDVAWNYNRIQSDHKIDGGIKANFFSPLASVETPDANTVVLHASQPWPAIFNVLAWTNLIDPQTPPEQNQPVGTGPFSFVEWVQGDHISMKKNPNYWQSGKPYLDGIQVKIYTDPQAMISEVEGGGIDVAILPTLRDAMRLVKDPNYQVVYNQNSGSVNLLLAQTKDGSAPTGNQLFRQALNYAIDRKRWTDTILLGVGTPKALPLVPSSPAYDAAKDQAYAFDLDKAKSLVQQSGVANPTVELLYSSVSADYATVLQIYQADLAKIGVTATLNGMQQVGFIDQLFNSKFTGLAANASLFGQLHPAFFWGNAYYSPNANWASFKSDEYSQLADGLLKETDPAKQKQVYAQWLDYILDQSWAMPFSNTVPRTVTTARVQGFSYNMTEFLMPNDVWLSS